MEQAIKYHSEITALAGQGVPIDWCQVARAMANMLIAERDKPKDE